MKDRGFLHQVRTSALQFKNWDFFRSRRNKNSKSVFQFFLQSLARTEKSKGKVFVLCVQLAASNHSRMMFERGYRVFENSKLSLSRVLYND